MTPTRKRPKPGKDLTPQEIRAEIRAKRAEIGIPSDGVQQRTWIRYQLHMRGWNQAKVGRAVDASETTVSLIYTGTRPTGGKADLVRELTAKILKIPEDVLFPEMRAGYDRREKERERREKEKERLAPARRERASERKRRDRKRARLLRARRTRLRQEQRARAKQRQQQQQPQVQDEPAPDVEGAA